MLVERGRSGGAIGTLPYCPLLLSLLQHFLSQLFSKIFIGSPHFARPHAEVSGVGGGHVTFGRETLRGPVSFANL